MTRAELHQLVDELPEESIPVDWSNGVSLEVLRLVGDRYVSGGLYDQGLAQVESPFPCTIDLGELAR